MSQRCAVMHTLQDCALLLATHLRNTVVVRLLTPCFGAGTMLENRKSQYHSITKNLSVLFMMHLIDA